MKGIYKKIPSGERFGKLQVVSEGPKIKKATRTYPTSVCICDCGEKVVVQNRLLVSGSTRSCGCLRREAAVNREQRHPRQLQVLEKGRKFGNLTVVGEAEPIFRKNGRRISRSIVECDCGLSKPFIVRNNSLLAGSVVSCGCKRRQMAATLYRRNPVYEKLPYGFSKTRLYTIFVGMHKRCEDKRHPVFLRYGGRGIEVCAEWNDFSAFREWALSHGYADKLTIDRIDNNKGYSPQNCRWASYCENERNKKGVRKFRYKGKWLYVGDIETLTGLSRSCIWGRLRNGWSIGDIISTPAYRKK